jgi:hypothetical protein
MMYSRISLFINTSALCRLHRAGDEQECVGLHKRSPEHGPGKVNTSILNSQHLLTGFRFSVPVFQIRDVLIRIQILGSVH